MAYDDLSANYWLLYAKIRQNLRMQLTEGASANAIYRYDASPSSYH
jgi:hypothetical protein